MIPTSYKDKLPRTLAYPVGAQILSEALADVPRIEELQLSFHRCDYQKAETDGSIKFLEAQYSKSNLGLSASHDGDAKGIYGPNWTLWVYAVPRQCNARVRELLRGEGFALLVDWLSAKRTETWLSSSHDLTLRFRADEESIVLIRDES